MRIGGEYARERPEMGNQRLGRRLGIALADRGEQQEFEQFVIGKRFGTARQQAFAQTLAVPGTGMRCRFIRIPRQPFPHAPRLTHLHCL